MNNPTLHLSINNNVIDCVNELKILGLLIDNNLTWKQHINTLSQKMSGIIGLLWRIRHFLSDNMKILFYNSYILSCMDYCLSIWGGAPKYILKKLSKLQKRVARIILKAKFDTPSSEIFSKLNWLSIYHRCVLTVV